MKKVKANGVIHELPDEVICLVANNGIRVDVPEYTEINSRKTIEYMEKLDQRKWAHISTGPLFHDLLDEILKATDTTLPEKIEDLNQMDYGVIHICGLTIMAFEAMCERRENVFFRTPEDHLHPRATQMLMTLLNKLQKLSGYINGRGVKDGSEA